VAELRHGLVTIFLLHRHRAVNNSIQAGEQLGRDCAQLCQVSRMAWHWLPRLGDAQAELLHLLAAPLWRILGQALLQHRQIGHMLLNGLIACGDTGWLMGGQREIQGTSQGVDI
jgi:hypothetical protein